MARWAVNDGLGWGEQEVGVGKRPVNSPGPGAQATATHREGRGWIMLGRHPSVLIE